MWAGISEGGAAEVVMHKCKKLTAPEWLKAVKAGKLKGAVRSLKPQGKRPWHVLCDNEKFLKQKDVMNACAKEGIKLWFVPPRSPDLNPVEKYWAWLRRELRQMDLRDLNAKRAVPTKGAIQRRVRNLMKTQKSQRVESSIARGFRKTCQKVIKVKGAHSGK